MDSVDHGSRGVELERDLEAECLDVPRRFMDDEQLDVRGGCFCDASWACSVLS